MNVHINKAPPVVQFDVVELLSKNVALVLEIKSSNLEIGRLNLIIERIQAGQNELTVNLESAHSDEIEAVARTFLLNGRSIMQWKIECELYYNEFQSIKLEAAIEQRKLNTEIGELNSKIGGLNMEIFNLKFPKSPPCTP